MRTTINSNNQRTDFYIFTLGAKLNILFIVIPTASFLYNDNNKNNLKD